jgi:hypothetical protein
MRSGRNSCVSAGLGVKMWEVLKNADIWCPLKGSEGESMSSNSWAIADALKADPR